MHDAIKNEQVHKNIIRCAAARSGGAMAARSVCGTVWLTVQLYCSSYLSLGDNFASQTIACYACITLVECT